MCPGRARSRARARSSMRVSTVLVRSAADIPVVVPWHASTETVNAVPMGSESPGAMSGSWSSSRRARSRGTQMIPEQWRTMNAMCRGVAFAAANIRSPSFSLSSSSTTTTMRPAAMSLIASSMESKVMSWVLSAPIRSLPIGKPLHVFGDDVHLDVHAHPRRDRPERGGVQRVRYESDLEGLTPHFDDGQRYAIERNRALVDEVAQNIFARGEPDAPQVVLFFDSRGAGDTIHMTLQEVASKPVSHSEGKLEIDSVAALEIAESRAGHGFRHDLRRKATPRARGYGEAGPVDRHGISDSELARHPGRFDLEVEDGTSGPAPADGAALDHDAGEHLAASPVWDQGQKHVVPGAFHRRDLPARSVSQGRHAKVAEVGTAAAGEHGTVVEFESIDVASRKQRGGQPCAALTKDLEPSSLTQRLQQLAEIHAPPGLGEHQDFGSLFLPRGLSFVRTARRRRHYDLGARIENPRRGRSRPRRVDDHARRPAMERVGARGQPGIVGGHRAGSDHDRVGGRPRLVHPGAGLGAGDPAGRAIGGRETAVQSQGELQAQIGAPRHALMDVGGVQFGGLVRAHPGHHLDSVSAQLLESLASHTSIGVLHG